MDINTRVLKNVPRMFVKSLPELRTKTFEGKSVVFFFNRTERKTVKNEEYINAAVKGRSSNGLQCRILPKRRLPPFSGNRENQDDDSHLGQELVSGEEWNRVILPTYGEQGWRSGESTRLPCTNVIRARFTDSASYVGLVCCWFSSLIREDFL